MTMRIVWVLLLGLGVVNTQAATFTVDADNYSLTQLSDDGFWTYGKPNANNPYVYDFDGNSPSNGAVEDAFAAITGDADIVWKSDDDGLALSGSYDWSGNGGQGGTISFVAGSTQALNCTVSCYLIVKGGQQVPIAYLLDLSILGWNGEDNLVLQNFWNVVSGSISHVAFLGSTKPPEFPRFGEVPLPASAWLFISALTGLGIIRRKRTAKA